MNTLKAPEWRQPSQGLRRPVGWVGVVLLAVLVAVGLARWSGLDPRTPDAPVQWQRSLQFADLPDGDISVLDATTQQSVARFSGEQGFLRSTLRALTRERRREKVGAAAPFLLVGRADGRLTLMDPATRQRIDLEAFGSSNAAVFARLRLAGTQDSPR